MKNKSKDKKLKIRGLTENVEAGTEFIDLYVKLSSSFTSFGSWCNATDGWSHLLQVISHGKSMLATNLESGLLLLQVLNIEVPQEAT